MSQKSPNPELPGITHLSGIRRPEKKIEVAVVAEARRLQILSISVIEDGGEARELAAHDFDAKVRQSIFDVGVGPERERIMEALVRECFTKGPQRTEAWLTDRPLLSGHAPWVLVAFTFEPVRPGLLRMRMAPRWVADEGPAVSTRAQLWICPWCNRVNSGKSSGWAGIAEALEGEGSYRADNVPELIDTICNTCEDEVRREIGLRWLTPTAEGLVPGRGK